MASSNYEKTEISHFTEAITEILCFPVMLRGARLFKGQRARDAAIGDRQQSSPPQSVRREMGRPNPRICCGLHVPENNREDFVKGGCTPSQEGGKGRPVLGRSGHCSGVAEKAEPCASHLSGSCPPCQANGSEHRG